MMYYLYLACILSNIVPNNGIVEAAVQLLQDRGLAGVSVHAGLILRKSYETYSLG